VKGIGEGRIRTEPGDFDTIVIKSLLKSEGTFRSRGDINICLTGDEKHISIRMRTRVAPGRVAATMTGGEYQGLQ
jgi:hypothetical protein